MQNALTVAHPQAITDNSDLRALVDDWRAALALRAEALDLAPATVTTYRAGLDKFLTWCESEAVSLVTGDTILSWRADLLRNGLRPNTANAWLAGVRSFFAWAVGNRRLVTDPTAGVKSATRKGTTKRHLREVLTDQEVKRVLAQPDRSTPQGLRDAAILALMAYTAVRSVEVHRANLADLQSNGGRLVLYVQGKGRRDKDEFIVIPGPAENELLDWLSARGRQPGPLFPSMSHRTRGERLSLRALRGLVKGYYLAAGVYGSGKTTHSLRHTAITNAAKRAPIQKVQSMARHANVQTTLIYYHELDRLTAPAEDLIDYDEQA